jgi:hypothetical protein
MPEDNVVRLDTEFCFRNLDTGERFYASEILPFPFPKAKLTAKQQKANQKALFARGQRWAMEPA